MGRSLVAIDPPVRPFKHLDDVMPFEVLKALGVVVRGRASGLDDGQQSFVHSDLRRAGEDYGTLNDVLKFTDVSRPIVGHESVHRLAIEGEMRSLMLGADLCEKMLREESNVLTAFPQWRDGDWKGVEKVVQVRSEGALLYRGA